MKNIVFKINDLSSNEKRLRVLLFDNDDFSDYTSYFARGISKYVDVSFYCFSDVSPILTGAAKQNGIRLFYINKRLPKSYSSTKGIIRVFILFFVLLNVLLRTKYDIVHIQDYLPTFFLFIPFLKLRGKRICWTLHDMDIFSLWHRLFATGIGGRLQVLFRKIVTQPSLMGRSVDLIFVHAFSHKQELMLKKVKEEKIHVIRQFDYNYLLEFESEIKKSHDSELGNNYVLFFGNIAPWKGIDTLIEASRLVNNKIGQKFSLVIAGKPYPGFEKIRFFEKLDLEKEKYINVINKYITSSEIPSLISKSSILVLPYDLPFRYSSSGVIPLSYTFSKPVIISSVSTLAEYVDHGKTGLIYEANDSKGLAKCIIELVENNPRRLEMGQAAHRKLVNEMSLDVCCEIINNLYNDVR